MQDSDGVRRRGLVVSAVGSAAAVLDMFDRVLVLGLGLLFAGLWRWWDLGVALTAVGGVLVALCLLAAARTHVPVVAAADGARRE